VCSGFSCSDQAAKLGYQIKEWVQAGSLEKSR